MKRICKQCGKEFVLSESEISFYKSKGLALPKRCKACRDQNMGQGGRATVSQGQKQGQTQTPVSVERAASNGVRREQASGRNQNGPDKSRLVISVAAVLFIVLAVLIKGVLGSSADAPAVQEDVASPNIEAGQEAQAQPLVEIPKDALPTESVGDTKQQETQLSVLPTAEATQEVAVKETAEPLADVQEVQETQEPAADVELEPAPEAKTYSFRKQQYLTEHFEKHGAEFPYATQEDYLLGANNVIQNPDALHKLEAEDGDDVYYVESTREFVVVSTDGYIRTYFLADLDYYNRQ